MCSLSRSAFLLVLGLAVGNQGCTDALSVPNPKNCVTSGSPCADGFTCSPETQRCEPQAADADCTTRPSLCGATEACDAELGRCLPQRFVLGQPDARSNLNASYGMYAPRSVKLVRDGSAGGKLKLVVADQGNIRTSIWNDVPSTNRPPDVVLGQQDVVTIRYSSITRLGVPLNAGTMYAPYSLASDGTRLLVADYSINRILIWPTLPTQSGGSSPLPAAAVWGQPNFMGADANAGSASVNALGFFRSAIFAESSPGAFYISDRENARVLVFDAIPNTPGTAPKWVIGQPDFVTGDRRTGPADLGSPYGLYSDGSQLFVADENRNRVLVYDLPITQNYPMPNRVIGQPDLLSYDINRGGNLAADTLATPNDVLVTNTGGTRRLWVADAGNHRILRYTLPSTTADLVLGQPGFGVVSNDPVSAETLAEPVSLSSDGVQLAVADVFDHRVLLWNSLPARNRQPCDSVVGQPSAATNYHNLAPVVHALQFHEPQSLSSDGKRLFLADTGHHRVLIWNQIPRDADSPPDVVLGQPNFSTFDANRGGVSARSLASPSDVRSDGKRLAVADADNNRILIWNQIPSSHFTPADQVLGQPDMLARDPDVSAQRLDHPQGLLFHGDSLLVSDSNNNRVLRFDAPYTTYATAQRVLGQPDMLSNQENAGMLVSARGLAHPVGLASDAGRLLIADLGNSRVLVWNQMPAAHFQPADVVLGAPDFVSDFPPADAALRVFRPAGLHAAAGKLYVASSLGSRVLIWNQIPTQNGIPASLVLGQPDLSSELPNHPALAPVERLSTPTGIVTIGERLFIADQDNSRVVSRELPQ